MHAFLSVCITLLASVNVNSLALSPIDTHMTLPTHDIYQFPNETWLENLAISQNGHILVTVLSSPELWQVDPFHANSPATLVCRIPGATGILGIVELEQDVFYTIAGNFTIATKTSTSGSYSIWKIDMRSISSPAIASKLTDIPEGMFLNGMAVLNQSKGLVVVGDAGAGVVFTIDVESGSYSKTIDDPTMKPTDAFPIGINGLKIRGGYLYYTTTAQELFSRIPIDSMDGSAAGPAEGIAKNIFGDDFALDKSGNAYIGENPKDVVAKVTPEGGVTVVAGSLYSNLVAGATSTGFGRTCFDHTVLYVTTSGGIESPVPVEGGKVVAIYT
jgi:hypothetical protein